MKRVKQKLLVDWWKGTYTYQASTLNEILENMHSVKHNTYGINIHLDGLYHVQVIMPPVGITLEYEVQPDVFLYQDMISDGMGQISHPVVHKQPIPIAINHQLFANGKMSRGGKTFVRDPEFAYTLSHRKDVLTPITLTDFEKIDGEKKKREEEDIIKKPLRT